MLTPEQENLDALMETADADMAALRTENVFLRALLVSERSRVECLEGQLETLRDGSNAHAANLTRMARENVELHTTLARYKAALEEYAADENWAYFVSDDSFSWQRDEHPATIAAKALHEDGATG